MCQILVMLRKINKKLYTMDIYYQCFQRHTQRNKFCERLTASNILECKKRTPHLNIFSIMSKCRRVSKNMPLLSHCYKHIIKSHNFVCLSVRPNLCVMCNYFCCLCDLKLFYLCIRWLVVHVVENTVLEAKVEVERICVHWTNQHFVAL